MTDNDREETNKKFRDVFIKVLTDGMTTSEEEKERLDLGEVGTVIIQSYGNRREDYIEISPFDITYSDESIKNSMSGFEGSKINQFMTIDAGDEDISVKIRKEIEKGGRCVAAVKTKRVQNIEIDPGVDNYRVVFIVVLRKDKEEFQNILEYVLQQVTAKVSTSKELNELMSGENSEKYYGDLCKNWYLMGDYAEYYLKKRRLPATERMIELSAAKYEGSESETRIYFTENGIETVSELEMPDEKERTIQYRKRRMIRKLMELSKSGEIYLYAETREENERIDHIVTRLVQVKQDAVQQSDIYIKFFGFLCWSVVEGEREVLTYKEGKYTLNYSRENESYIADIDNLETEIEKQNLKDLVEILRKQKHGTLAIVWKDNDAMEEVLAELSEKNRAVCLEKPINALEKPINAVKEEKMILSLTGVDGALFINSDGQCKAFSVLLDGEAVVKGDVGRGSRYNSAVNYVAWRKEDCVAIIISEDGMINVFSKNQKREVKW